MNQSEPNIYEQYIAYLKTTQTNRSSRSVKSEAFSSEYNLNGIHFEQSSKQTEKFEKHRILPEHAGEMYVSSNILYLTFQEHKLAHFYRYLSFQDKGDLIAYKLMSGQTEEGRQLMSSYAGKIGGVISGKKNKAQNKLFFNKLWQKEFGYKDAGKRNVSTGFLASLNDKISKENPSLRKRAVKLGAKARIEKQKKSLSGLFDSKKRVQRKGNLVRWGIVINGVCLPFKKLSSDFIDYYIEYGNPFKK
uniref:HNH homing endonuclease n=1 Tax=Scotinosphaera sp. NIES-154 TaxID=2249731 RepID=A0A2Z4MAZ2_9CHLO|nr:hypothetical protein [Scotinosphaera sp. NIES-154]